MPTANRVLYRNILLADFLAELNFMAGVLHARHPDRLRLMGDVMASLQAAIARPDILRLVVPYDGNIQGERIAKTALMATTLYGERIDQLTEEQVQRYAISGVDRILEYLTTPKANGKFTPWNSLSFFNGLQLGDARRWVISLPDQAESGALRTTAEDFYGLTSSHQQQLSNQLETEQVRAATVRNDYLAVVELHNKSDLERREMDSKLHKMVQEFIKALQQHFSVLEAPRTRHSNFSSATMDLQARLHRLTLRYAVTPEITATLTRQLQARLPAVLVNGRAVKKVDDFDAYLNQYLVEPSYTHFRDYFFRTTIKPLLIQGETDVSRDTLFSTLQTHIATNAKPWLPIFIDLQAVNALAIDLSTPFLPQYFSKGLGYDAMGVANLKAHYQFVFFLAGLDQCQDRELLRRIYCGEETAEWQAKLVFTASNAWEPPIQGSAVAIKRVHFDAWTVTESQDPEAATLLAEPAVRSLVSTVTVNHPVIKPSGKIERVKPNAEISSLDLNAWSDVQPVLVHRASGLLPTTRHQLYAVGLRQYLGEQYEEIYPKIRALALSLFQQGSASINVRIDSSALEPVPHNFLFLSGSIQRQAGVVWHRYVFTQTIWRDYLIAEALWQACYSDEENPETHLWNLHAWPKDYPGVLDFLADFLRDSPSRSVDMVYLQQQWLANGALVCWQNVFINTSALLERVKPSSEEDSLMDGDYSSSVSRVHESAELTLKTTVIGNYVRIRPHWEMRLLERLGISQESIKLSAFATLGHGAGISPVSPNYDKPIAAGIRDDRRYYRMNTFDRMIASELLKKAHEAISAGDITSIQRLVPDSWGFYTQDTLLQASQHLDEIDVIRAEWQYAEMLKKAVLVPINGRPVTSQIALARMKIFAATELELLAQQERDYLQKCTTDHSWYNQAGIRVTASDSTIAERLAHYQRSVQLRTKVFVKWLAAAISQQPMGNLLEQCEEKINVFKENEFSHQEDITALTERGAALLEGTAQRFAILMNSFASTRTIYQAYTVEQQELLTQEIAAGRLNTVVKRFKPYFLAEQYGSLASVLNNQIGLARETLFLTWIEGAAPPHILLKALWPKLKKSWQEGDPEFHAARQQRALMALRSGDVKSLISDLDALFKLSNAAKATLEPELTKMIDQGRLDAIEHYLQQLPTWNRLTPEVQVALRQRLKQGALTKFALSTLVTDYPQVFIQPTDVYLKRYLRFGLAVDACDEMHHNTLLFLTIKILAARENHSLESTQNVYEIIQYLINAGATVMVRSNDSHLNTPLAYVHAHREINQENKRWDDIQQALETVLNWFELQEGEDIIFEAINRIYEIVDHYKTIFYASSFNPLKNLMSRLNWLLRPRDIQKARISSMTTYPLDAERLLSDRFHIKENMQKLKDQAQDAPTRMKMGRLDTSVFNGVEACESTLNHGIPQSSAVLMVRPAQPNSSHTSSSSWFGSFFCGGGGSTAEAKETRKLRAEAATVKKELVNTRSQLAKANILVEQLSARDSGLIESSQTTAPPVDMTTSSTMHQANRPQIVSLSQLRSEELARNA